MKRFDSFVSCARTAVQGTGLSLRNVRLVRGDLPVPVGRSGALRALRQLLPPAVLVDAGGRKRSLPALPAHRPALDTQHVLEKLGRIRFPTSYKANGNAWKIR